MALEREHGLTARATPAQMLDQALTLLRHASAAQWLRGVSAGLPLAAVLLALYAFVHVAGARPPLALFGLLCALAYWLRFRALATLAHELVPCACPGQRTAGVALFSTAMAAGIRSWFWAVALVAAAQSSLSSLLVCLPLLGARGAFAPSLLARSVSAPETGLQALARASADTRGQRALFLGVELLALLGLLLLFGNLYALTALVLLVASSVLGLDVGFVTALIAPDNELVPLLLLGLALLMLEPLRAAISALAYQSARERWQGADLDDAITALAQVPRGRSSVQPKAAARVLLVLLLAGAPAIADAQSGAGSDVYANEAEDARAFADVGAIDVRARARARAILAQPEFLPSGIDSEQGAWWQWMAKHLRERELPDRDASAPPRFELRLPPSLLVLGSTVLLFGVGFWLTRSLRRRKARAAARVAEAPPNSDDRIAEASKLAERQQYDLGLRSLYAACLSVLGRFDTAQTNGEVLQRIQSPPLQAAFARVTEIVEPCCYGHARATRDDFERARALTDQILREAASRGPSEASP